MLPLAREWEFGMFASGNGTIEDIIKPTMFNDSKRRMRMRIKDRTINTNLPSFSVTGLVMRILSSPRLKVI